jgi:hypothetical protein
MSTRTFPGGKGDRWVGLMTSPTSCAECHGNLGAWTSWNPLDDTGSVTEILYPYLYVMCMLTYWYTTYTSYVPNYCNPCNPSFSIIRNNFGPFHFELSTICCTWMNNERCLTLFLRRKFENFKENFVNTYFFFMSFLSVRKPTSSWLRPKVNYNTSCIYTWCYSSVAASPPFHMWAGADPFPEKIVRKPGSPDCKIPSSYLLRFEH